MSWFFVFLISLIAATLLLIVGMGVVKLGLFKTRFELSSAIVVSVSLIACASLFSPLCGWSLWLISAVFLAVVACILLVRRKFLAVHKQPRIQVLQGDLVP